ncbi:LysR substrate-binding domain-containing protein [Aquimarina sp. I32.4]|uniref:LysR substrate-binding domain-containing protein n=1 Tax=Aquimarina sp. I32.4 TaxID=2053903 RepID=UPI000CDE941A|nr:LysR substrate-binding domain-containing protein [Aquimarina sp. I32.4]
MKTKLHIFKEVAYHLSFTKAAEHLFLSQPAISKTIRLLEDEYKSTFFLRKRNSIELTEDGKVFLIYTKKILKLYAELDNQFLSLEDKKPTHITFGVSTTLANYIVPKIIAKFRKHSPQTNFIAKSGNSKEVEALIINQQIDFGIIEGQRTNYQLQFKKFIKDEIVLVTNARNTDFKNGIISKDDLTKIPLIERELGSGTRQVIYNKLQELNINKLNIQVILNSTEAIKNYLYYSDSYAFVSINAVHEDLLNNKLKVVDIKDMSFERWFYFVSRTGFQSKIMDYFEKLIVNNYNF